MPDSTKGKQKRVACPEWLPVEQEAEFRDHLSRLPFPDGRVDAHVRKDARCVHQHDL